MDQPKCYKSNSDIAGIGVRMSVYIQALLGFAPAILATMDGYIDANEEDLLHTIYANLLLTGCGLLVASFIQVKTRGMNVYHSLIVLNLSWLVNASALTVCIIPTLEEMGGVLQWAKNVWPTRRKRLLELVLVAVHLWMMSGFGIWVWHDPSAFYLARFPEAKHEERKLCLSLTKYTVFGHDVPVQNASIRSLSLALYSVAGIPMVNAYFFVVVMGLFGRFFRWPLNGLMMKQFEGRRPQRSYYFAAMFPQLLVSIYFMVNTELMIRRSKHLVLPGEDGWSFGQVLAMLLVIFPFYEGVVKPTARNWLKMGLWVE